MGYTMANGRYADMLDVSALDPQTLGVTTNGAAVEVGDRGDACLELNVTAGSGTNPTADVKIQTSKDGSGSGLGAWRDVAAFAQATGVTSERKSFTGLDRFIRTVVTIGGTGSPSFTLGVSGELKR